MQVNFHNDHNNPTDSQVFIAITGDTDSIVESLKKLLQEIALYGKPLQGTVGSTSKFMSIITPLWNGKRY